MPGGLGLLLEVTVGHGGGVLRLLQNLLPLAPGLGKHLLRLLLGLAGHGGGHFLSGQEHGAHGVLGGAVLLQLFG